MLLTTECVITEVKKDEPAMPMGGGMPGMMYGVSLRPFYILTALFIGRFFILC